MYILNFIYLVNYHITKTNYQVSNHYNQLFWGILVYAYDNWIYHIDSSINISFITFN